MTCCMDNTILKICQFHCHSPRFIRDYSGGGIRRVHLAQRGVAGCRDTGPGDQDYNAEGIH